MLIGLALFCSLPTVAGCAPACDEAASLCKECELVTDDCDSRFDQASVDYCEGAVEVYEQSCPAAQ
jgi:hypothetical protein